jgi:hypothetical protein
MITILTFIYEFKPLVLLQLKYMETNLKHAWTVR